MFHGGETPPRREDGWLPPDSHGLAKYVIIRHMYGETPPGDIAPSEFDLGFLVGVLVGEGHFGGDGRQPQVTLRMHTRHEHLFLWLQATFPGGRLYGPYHHGGRSYYQWMVRGDYLRTTIVPIVAGRIEAVDDYAAARFQRMCRDYGIALRNSDSIQASTPPGSI